MMTTPPQIIVIVGPTASGKSDFAVELALSCNGEIISADSRQLYKNLDIGTGKITEEEMKGITHHMLSVYELEEEVSVARYARDATSILLDILKRGKTPIICGGTGQYIDALISTKQIPEVKPNKRLREILEKKTTEELFKELQEKDKRRALSIDSKNRVRIIRALEIINILGHVPEENLATFIYPTELYLMDIDRILLRERIEKRYTKRMEIGMLEEVKKIKEKGYTETSMKKFGLEYVTLLKLLNGNIGEKEAREEIITKSMQYAKRQQTWNKKYLPFAKSIEVKK